MCGIVGFVGGDKAASIAFRALEKLEYRGYDSAGMATIHHNSLMIRKHAGTLEEVELSQRLSELPGSVAIAHTRWATHGKADAINAHPHSDCRGRIAIVHNGIIENYQELRSRLEKRGHSLKSETDTEVIAHLIEEYLSDGETSLESAIMAAIDDLEGSYAFLAIKDTEPEKIVGVCKGSPLVLGVAEDGCLAASDAISFLDHTRDLIFVEDDEIAVLTKKGIVLLDNKGKRIHRIPIKVDWKCDDGGRGNCRHFMLKEITEQSQSVRWAAEQDKEFFTETAMDILRANQVIITACGSSRYAALVGRFLFSKVGNKFCDVVMAPEFHYFSESINKNTVVIAVSQSGETADVVQGVKKAKENGAKIVSIVNKSGTILSRLSDRVINLNAGPEIGVAATKSFSCQLSIFYLLSYAMVNRFESGVNTLNDVSRAMEIAVEWNDESIQKLASELHNEGDFYYIARGINFAIASEGALKLKEISYIHAEGLPAGELKHGTLALIQEGTPVVVICPRDYTFSETLTNAHEAKSRGAYIVGVSDVVNDIYDFWVRIPRVEEIFYPLVSVVPLQLLAYHLAVRRGNNPDKPRNLAKSVTVK
ncbi:MAG: glutamine--fructose-6-phosphate transaminase (isomerizing) [Chloroflexota bacterium]|nr:glutamine--fructose-6-phosphate transaminase (isomerizing) [Chloroflexota bacterium]